MLGALTSAGPIKPSPVAAAQLSSEGNRCTQYGALIVDIIIDFVNHLNLPLLHASKTILFLRTEKGGAAGSC